MREAGGDSVHLSSLCLLLVSVRKRMEFRKEQPPVWFHEVFYQDDKPYREREVQIIRELTGTK
jgi:hypothetical protein